MEGGWDGLGVPDAAEGPAAREDVVMEEGVDKFFPVRAVMVVAVMVVISIVVMVVMVVMTMVMVTVMIAITLVIRAVVMVTIMTMATVAVVISVPIMPMMAMATAPTTKRPVRRQQQGVVMLVIVEQLLDAVMLLDKLEKPTRMLTLANHLIDSLVGETGTAMAVVAVAMVWMMILVAGIGMTEIDVLINQVAQVNVPNEVFAKDIGIQFTSLFPGERVPPCLNWILFGR